MWSVHFQKGKLVEVWGYKSDVVLSGCQSCDGGVCTRWLTEGLEVNYKIISIFEALHLEGTIG